MSTLETVATKVLRTLCSSVQTDSLRHVANALGDTFEANTTLQTLDISSNYVGADGASALAAALQAAFVLSIACSFACDP